jgi:hypothetical protein
MQRLSRTLPIKFRLERNILMAFLKKLFGTRKPPQRDDGLYYYVRLFNIPNKATPTDEIIELRINRMNDISQDDHGQYFVRKVVSGTRKFKRAELTLYFDAERRQTNFEITGGELATEEDYLAYREQLAKPKDQSSQGEKA